MATRSIYARAAGILGCAYMLALSSATISLDVTKNGCEAEVKVPKDQAFPYIVGIRDTTSIVFECTPTKPCDATIRIPLPAAASGPGAGKLHMYGFHYGSVDSSLQLLHSFTLPSANTSCHVTTTTTTTTASAPVIGVLYEGWQAYAANASAYVQAMGGTPISVEMVLRSNQTLGIEDVWDKYGVGGLTQGFYWQETPTLGYYCIYRKRPNETVGILPDCLAIDENVKQQAAWLSSAGVSFVTADGTNLCTPSPFADAIQSRPMEVLMEEFIALRAAGVATPAVVAWQRSVTGCTLWANVLDLYNDPFYSQIIYVDPATQKKVFFVPDSPDPNIVAQIESNGGRNDILVQEMWALFDPTLYSQGRWGFMSPCTANSSSTGTPIYTTSVVGLGRGASGCGQFTTTNSNLGSVTTLGPSYQLSYGSVPFSAANKYEGLTFKRQFGTLFDNQQAKWAQIEETAKGASSSSSSLENTHTLHQQWEDIEANVLLAFGNSSSEFKGLPNSLYFSSWNEWLSQPQPNPFNSNYSYSMGLSYDSLSYRTNLWVDTYGTSLSRDIEPSVSHGTLMYDIMTSCLRVVTLSAWAEKTLKESLANANDSFAANNSENVIESMHIIHRLQTLQKLFGSDETSSPSATSSPPPHRPRRLTSCSVAGEMCCAYNETTDGYNIVFSVQLDSKQDALLTIDPTELANLTCPGCGWTQVCNGYGGGTDFCVDGSVLKTPQAMQGPFALMSSGCGVSRSSSTTNSSSSDGNGAISLPGRLPLVRCYDGIHHFISNDPTCGGGTAKMEMLIGCTSQTQSSNTPRGIRACTTGGMMRYHMLDAACVGADIDNGFLGYVH